MDVGGSSASLRVCVCVCVCVRACLGKIMDPDSGSSVTLIYYRIGEKWWKEPFLNVVAAAAQMSTLTHVELAIGGNARPSKPHSSQHLDKRACCCAQRSLGAMA